MMGPWTEASCPGPLSVTHPHWSGHGIHVSHPITSSFIMWLVLIVTTAGPNITAILNGFGGTSQTSSGDWSLCKHTVTPMKPGSGIAHWTTSDSLVGEGGSYWMADTLNSLFWGCKTSLSPKLQLWGLHFGPLDKGGICSAATTGLEVCNTFSQPGNWFGGFFSAVSSMAMSTVISFLGESASVGWTPTGIASSGGAVGDSSRRATPLNTSSSEKET